MAVQDIDVRATTTAPAERVWGLLDDSLSWPTWTPIETARILEPRGCDGLGEVRSFVTGRVTVKEEVVERSAAERLSYVLLEGLAVRDYRAEISLLTGGGQTEIRWHTTFRPRVPGSGWLYGRALRKATEGFVEGLVRHAERRPPAG